MTMRAESDYLKSMLARGFIRFYNEGMNLWSRKDLNGAINPRGDPPREVNDPAVQEALRVLEVEKLIRLHLSNDTYLEVLDPISYRQDHPLDEQD